MLEKEPDRKAYHAARYVANRAKILEQTHEYKRNHRAEIKKRNAKYYADPIKHEKHSETMAKWYQANKEKVAARVAYWQAANPIKLKAAWRKFEITHREERRKKDEKYRAAIQKG
jgi:hypothetical protein